MSLKNKDLEHQDHLHLCSPCYCIHMQTLGSEEVIQKWLVWHVVLEKILWIPWATRKLNRWVLMQRKSETPCKVKMPKLKLYYFKCIMRREGSLGKAIMLGNMEGSRKREKADMRWIVGIKETMDMSLQGLSGMVEGGILWTQIIHRVCRSQTEYHTIHTCLSVCNILGIHRYAIRIN